MVRSGVPQIDFVGKSPIFVTLSGLLVLASIVLFFTKGMNYGIDFAGGTEVQYKFSKAVSAGEIRDALSDIQMQDAMVQAFGKPEENEFLVRVAQSSSDPQRYDAELQALVAKAFTDRKLVKARYVADKAYMIFDNSIEPNKLINVLNQLGKGELTVHDASIFGKPENFEYLVNFSGISKSISQSLEKKFGTGSFELRREDTVGPKVGKELRSKSMMAMLVTLVLLLIYIWFRFDMIFAPGAIIALFHDAMITVGIFCILGLEMNLSVLAALLTLIGYSLNDTIVVYDRIRENNRRMKGASLAEVINVSINQTLSRTIMTATATLLSTIALMVWGGEILFNFAFALSFGIIVGAYSTVYIASPLAIMLNRRLAQKA